MIKDLINRIGIDKICHILVNVCIILTFACHNMFIQGIVVAIIVDILKELIDEKVDNKCLIANIIGIIIGCTIVII